MSLTKSPKLLSADRLAWLIKDFFDDTVFVDIESKNRMSVHRVSEVTAVRQSPYQLIEIFRSPHLGRVLSLDGKIQVAESDEHLYHELLIHPACAAIPNVSSALILGGGDGCALRELLKYDEIDLLQMVDLDGDVIELCREHFSAVNDGALDNPRAEIHTEECRAFLEQNRTRSYDLIVADLTEPYDTMHEVGDLSKEVFSPEFYEFIKSYLTTNGILSVQTGGVTYHPHVDKYHLELLEDLRSHFQTVATAYVYIHSFDAVWTITLAADYDLDVSALDVDTVLGQKGVGRLVSYDGPAHRAAFAPNRRLRMLSDR